MIRRSHDGTLVGCIVRKFGNGTRQEAPPHPPRRVILQETDCKSAGFALEMASASPECKDGSSSRCCACSHAIISQEDGTSTHFYQRFWSRSPTAVGGTGPMELARYTALRWVVRICHRVLTRNSRSTPVSTAIEPLMASPCVSGQTRYTLNKSWVLSVLCLNRPACFRRCSKSC